MSLPRIFLPCMSLLRPLAPFRPGGRRIALCAVLSCAAIVAGTNGTQTADANGETRTVSIYHTHTKESAQVTFRRNGVYDREALKQLNWLLRDWRRDEPIDMDPRLFDTVWQVYREVGSSEPIHIVSAYRSPQTNSMLRRRSRAVAEHSQHMLGKAMDFFLPDADMAKVRAIGMRLQNGGVGYYPNSHNAFVHLDVGGVRSWPRMTRDQLARLFPDGKTVHIPADGRPLPGYELARAEILANGGKVAGATMVADAGDAAGSGSSGKSFWARLFGSADEDEDAAEALASRTRGRVQVASASAGSPFGSDDSRSFFAQDAARHQAAQQRATRPVAPPSVPVAAPSAPVTQTAPQVAVADPVPSAGVPTLAQGVPLPMARPAELTPLAPRQTGTQVAALAEGPAGPRLAWQAGPAAVAGAIQPEDVTAALPPAVPVPLPTARPIELASLGAAGVMAYAPVNAPLPPSRPATLVPLTEQLIPVAKAEPRPAPRVAALAPAQMGVALVPPTSRTQVSREERAELQTLFVANALGRPQPQATVSVARAKVLSAGAAPAAMMPPQRAGDAVVSRFGGATELTTDRFSGPAVKPVATVTFASR